VIILERIKTFFSPREDRILPLLIEQSEVTVRGLAALEAYMKRHSEKQAAAVVQADRDADEIRRMLIEELNRTFVTPMDREAVAKLFIGPQDMHHVMEMLKLRELYRHLSNCADRGDQAANIIHDIVVKMT
jgi:uncharacterized protein Yka (UPF0111/DUF47 family)